MGSGSTQQRVFNTTFVKGSQMPVTPENILAFWFEETPPKLHFQKNAAFDQEIATRFEDTYLAAIADDLDSWGTSPEGALALVIILDQFSRNLHRDSPAAFAHDAKAVAIAGQAIDAGFDLELPDHQRAFLYMPFMHAEDLALQEKSVALFTKSLPDSNNIQYAEEHRDIIKNFGRFPHRNKTLRRTTTAEEQQFLENGGFDPT